MKHGKKLLSVLLALVMVLALLPSAAFAAEGEKHITILGTSDMHGNIWGFSYEDSKETDNNGMARLYTYRHSRHLRCYSRKASREFW